MGLRPQLRERFAEMATSPWYVEVIRVSSLEKQQDLLRLLHEVVSVTALGSTSDSEHFVIFECTDLRLKIAIEKMFGEVDPASLPTYTSRRRPMQPHRGGAA